MKRQCLAALALLASPAVAAPVLPDFGAATFVPGQAIDHVYFPVRPGVTRVYEASGVDDGVPFVQRSVQRAAGAGPTLLGVQTIAALDRATIDGQVVEDTLDYYAQDAIGNVWYFGEDVTNYRYDASGDLIGTDNASAWLAGVSGALPGLIMPASPSVGFNYYQEFAVTDMALDQATIWALGQSVDGYDDVLVTFETSEIDPDAREFKYYAPGLGLFRMDEDLDETLADPELIVRLTQVSAVPLPMSLPLLSFACASLALLSRRRRQ